MVTTIIMGYMLLIGSLSGSNQQLVPVYTETEQQCIEIHYNLDTLNQKYGNQANALWCFKVSGKDKKDK